MFDRDVDYPTAVASYDDEGVAAAIAWCVEYLQQGDTLSVWTSLKSNLQNCSKLQDLVRRSGGVEHITGRGGTPPRSGPVLMAWADMDDIGELVRYNHGIRALCVITWNEDKIRPWVTAMKPTIFGDRSAWEHLSPGLHPVVVEELTSLTRTINHNNTISAGFEKDKVVGVLRALHDAGIPIDAETMQGWALANGWSGENPGKLAKYVRDINLGKRPRIRKTFPVGYVDRLRDWAESVGAEEEG